MPVTRYAKADDGVHIASTGICVGTEWAVASTVVWMARRDHVEGQPRRRPRPPLPARQTVAVDANGMSHEDFVEALRAIDGLVDVTGGGDRPNFHLRHKPFLHFHTDPNGGGVYADVKLDGRPGADFVPVWASTPAEREDLLRRVRQQVRRAARR